MKNEFKDCIYSVLIKGLFHMDKKSGDRENQILTVFAYENFEEYCDENFHWWLILKFSKVELLFAAIFRNYIRHQLHCITDKCDDAKRKDEVDEYICSEVNENVLELMEMLKKKRPNVYKRIEELHTK